MKRRLMDILACPACRHHPLVLEVGLESDGEVMEGTLSCPGCGSRYPIIDGIPDLMPPAKE